MKLGAMIMYGVMAFFGILAGSLILLKTQRNKKLTDSKEVGIL